MKKFLFILGILILNSSISLAANNLISADWWKTATLDKVKSEIANGADVNAAGTDKAGNGDLRTNVTPLMFALKYGNPSVEVIESLIKAGADVNEKENTIGLTPLIYAVDFNENPKIIQTLIKAGADININDKEGGTALIYAAQFNKNDEVAKSLIKAGANVNAKNNAGATALMVAAGANKNPEIIKSLINVGADVNAKTNEGFTALMAAAGANKNSEIVKILIKARADVNAKTNEGFTALMLAVGSNKNPEIVKTLVNAGADIDAITTANNGRSTALSLAFGSANREVWKYLAKLKVKEFCELTSSNSGEVYLCEDKVNLYLKKEEKLQSCARNMMAIPYITRLAKVLPTAEDPNKTVMSMIGLAIEFNCSISGYVQQ
ncbi:MAG: ankyrin repeat domain-containing protein [Alphaproteobacteria bacterium]|nr:ankyrin repeat domain-containing protein [Alphaproteobacteria bacterium]